jgi:hypothetical protein
LLQMAWLSVRHDHVLETRVQSIANSEFSSRISSKTFAESQNASKTGKTQSSKLRTGSVSRKLAVLTNIRISDRCVPSVTSLIQASTWPLPVGLISDLAVVSGFSAERILPHCKPPLPDVS